MTYQLSARAAAAQRQWDRSRAVVPLTLATPAPAPSEQRMIGMEDIWGLSSTDAAAIGIVNMMAASDVVVTIDSALTVPAVSAAVNFIAGSLAALPLDLYRRREKGREVVSGGVATMLHDAVNDELTSYEWRKGLFTAKLTGGRGLTYIERSPAGTPLSLWPMDPDRTTIRRVGWSREYEYRDGLGVKTYPAADVIDLAWMMKPDGLGHRGPISMGRDVIGMAIALTQYGSRYFAGGGVPPFAVTGNFKTGAGMQRAADDLAAAVRKAAKDNRQALVLPENHDIKSLGVDPAKGQMIDAQRFVIEQIARLYSLPPLFVQDLTHGTYSNSDQQDRHVVKHTLLHHAKQFEQELNLKLFGARRRSQYVELNLDGIMRGEFLARMQGWAQAVQHGLVKPSEVRDAENWPEAEGADRLFMQAQMLPIDADRSGVGGTPPQTGAE